MSKIPVIIDCDPGIDDVLAIVLAMAKDNLDIKAITTVAGNVNCEKTTRNAKLLLNLLKSDIVLAQGTMQPLVKTYTPASVHGSDGLGDLSYELEEADYEHFTSENAVSTIKNILEESDEKITIIAVGPLTNIALLLATYPHLKEKIELLSIMGGGLNLGNRSSTAEFNIFADPEAAHIVLNSDVPIVMATLNATYQARLEEDDIHEFDFISNDVTKFFNKIMWRYASLDSALHDPVSVLAVTNPEMFEYEDVKLNVETNEGATRGMTYVDHKGNQTKTRVISKVNRASVIKEIASAFKYFNTTA